MPSPRFDRSLLPPADLEFVVVSDTHYMVDVGDAPLEFESRRRQGERAGAAWRAIAGLDPAFVVHLGDMVQEFPGRPDYDRAVREALDQVRGAGLWERCRFAAGNHDIGDRPDPTMPTGEATEESLDTWERRHGPSWHAWDAAGVRFLVLNSQLFNTGLAAHARQRAWLEAQLEEAGCRPCVLFLHMPPYLADPGEPWLGHYDNLGEPDRGWLLDLVRRHRVLAMFAGHVHFQFYDLVSGETGVCRYHVTPSPSFTRPGFSHLFTSAPPPEQGRDDEEKLGFFLCRMAGGRLDVHRLRMAALRAAGGGASLITPLPAASVVPSRGGPGFAAGVTLRHALAPRAEVPLAWPSVIRQPVRNDYPLLACLEMGVSWVRAPLADLADPVQARRLEVLRAEGVRVQAVALGEEEALAHAAALAGADALEVQLPGRLLPETRSLAALGKAAPPLVLAPVLPGQPVPGKQHHRTRIGFAPEELDDLGEALGEPRLTAAACRLDPADPWETARLLEQARGRRAWQLQLLAEMPGVDDGTNANCVARAMLAAASLDVPLFLEPLVDLDRTMDVARGLLDTRCNPRPPFEVARCLGALLRRGAGRAVSVSRRGSCEIASLGDEAFLVIVEAGSVRPGDVLEQPPPGPLWSCRLAVGAVTAYEPRTELTPEDGPLLVVRRAD